MVLNRLWKLVNVSVLLPHPDQKRNRSGSAPTPPVGAKRRRDKPATPLDRLLAAGVLSPAQAAELVAYRDSLNPAKIAREIADLQIVLLKRLKRPSSSTSPRSPAHCPTSAKVSRQGLLTQDFAGIPK